VGMQNALVQMTAFLKNYY